MAAQPSPQCSQWEGNCAKSSKIRKRIQGIFCANFYWSMGNFPPYHQMCVWKMLYFRKRLPFSYNLSSETWTNKESRKTIQEEKHKLRTVWEGKLRDKKDLQKRRDGDHMMVPFECDIFIFRKLKALTQGLFKSRSSAREMY